MTRETKFGLLLVLTLTSVFGFLVWKKMHQPKDLVATTQATETTSDEEGTLSEHPDALQEVSPPATPLASLPLDRHAPRRPVTPVGSTPNGDELFPSEPTAHPVTRSKPKLPVNLDEQGFFDPPKAAPNPVENRNRTVSADPDPFAAPDEATVSSQPALPAKEVDPFAGQSVPVTTANKAAAEADPFGDAVPVTSRVSQPAETELPEIPPSDPDPFGNVPLEEPARQPVVIETPGETAVSVTAEGAPSEIMELPSKVESPPARRVEFAAEAPVQEPAGNADPFNESATEAAVEISARSSVPAETVAQRNEPVIELPPRSNPRTVPTLAAQDPDPFFTEAPTPTPVQAIPERQSPRLPATAPLQEPDPFGTPAALPNIPARTEPVPAQAESLPGRPERFPVRAEPLPVRAEPEPMRSPSRLQAPVAFSGETYIVQPNDNFWTISKKVYGAGRYFEALAKYNATLVVDPTRMKPGLKVATPTATELQTRYPQLLAAAGTQEVIQDPAQFGLPGDVYVAQSGDNFWEISKKLYGDGKYFRALEQHNSIIVNDSQKIQPGMKLAAPKAAWLQAKYPQLIGSAAPGVAELQRSQPHRYQPEEPAGFFLGPGDQPMYRVGTRDTLGEIAQNYLGRSSRWIQIYHLNRDVLTDGNALNVGLVLKLPADASRVVLIEEGSPRR